MEGNPHMSQRTTSPETHATSNPAAARLGDRRLLTPAMSLMLAAAWVAFLGTAFVVQPPSPDAVPSPAGELIGLVLWSSLMAACFGLGVRARLGATATVVGGLAIIAGAGYCYLDGHTGPWIVAQMAAGGALAASGWAGRTYG